MSFSNIAIIIPTYNRPIALKRLLNSISCSNFLGNNNVDLIISCDYSGEDFCRVVADDFIWGFGRKKVIVHDINLGLREHVFFCGDLVKDYDGIIMLEDDLFVSPNFYKYVVESNSFFQKDTRIGQISLYNYRYDEYSSSIFNPIGQNADNFFMQVPSSWGQFWTKNQWISFRESYKRNELDITENCVLPTIVKRNWPESSWKKYLYHYLIKENLFVVYPYTSLSTNFGEVGTHFEQRVKFTHSALAYNTKNFQFASLDNSKSVYDYNFELHPMVYSHYLSDELREYNVEFDLNGTKELTQINADYLISMKDCKAPIRTFSNDLLPQELNIILDNEGQFYSLGRTEDFTDHNPRIKRLKRNLDFIPTGIISALEKETRKEYERMLPFRIHRRLRLIFNLFKINS
ncbi:glycosyltransferase family A protein [Formosa sp. S-31]|uniref:glycosyltransferase family A protein n=1 Tax=Formosa sp. S-31 TaxID=2790949 RepID=UPI003EB8B722